MKRVFAAMMMSAVLALGGGVAMACTGMCHEGCACTDKCNCKDECNCKGQCQCDGQCNCAGQCMNAMHKQAMSNPAGTPAEHQKLAAFYDARARKLAAQADEHAAMAKAYTERPTVSEVKRPGATDTAAHCKMLAAKLAKEAQESRAQAEAHAEMAGR